MKAKQLKKKTIKLLSITYLSKMEAKLLKATKERFLESMS